MLSDFQDLAALAIVLLAASYVVWSIIARLRRNSGNACGSACNGCGKESSLGAQKALVQLGDNPHKQHAEVPN